MSVMDENRTGPFLTGSDLLRKSTEAAAAHPCIPREAFPKYTHLGKVTCPQRHRPFSRRVCNMRLRPGAYIPNLDCGPASLETRSPAARDGAVTACDHMLGFEGASRALRVRGFLAGVDFFVGHKREVQFEPRRFIVSHDLFYDTTLGAAEILRKYARDLSPCGPIQFDLMGIRDRRGEQAL